MESVIDQYLNVVRPMHLQFVWPSKRYAHLIIPEGGHNKVAIDLIATKIQNIIRERDRLRALGQEIQAGQAAELTSRPTTRLTPSAEADRDLRRPGIPDTRYPFIDRILISSEEIQLRVRQLGNEISRDYQGSTPDLRLHPQGRLSLPGRSDPLRLGRPRGRFHGRLAATRAAPRAPAW